MHQMRAAAAAGITIPIRSSGVALPTGPSRMAAAAQFSTGGWVRGAGSGTSDSVPAHLSDGEFVVNAAAAGQHGALLSAINAGYPADSLLAAGSPGSGGGSPAAGPTSITFGNIIVQGGANASPEQIAAAIGRQVRDAFSGLQADTEWGVV